MSPSKRSKVALGIAWVATVVALAVSVLPGIGRRLDQVLAILTLTLIAVIWYTYFTYRVVTKDEPTIVQLALEFDPERLAVRPIVMNKSPRALSVALDLSARWDDGTRVDFNDPFYEGKDSFPLGPHEGIGGWMPVQRLHGFADDRKELRARMLARWTDDLDEKGQTNPRYWIIEITRDAYDRPTGRISAVIASANIKNFFSE